MGNGTNISPAAIALVQLVVVVGNVGGIYKEGKVGFLETRKNRRVKHGKASGVHGTRTFSLCVF